VVQGTKRGQTFVLDRLTGKPLVPVTERKVPTDGVPTETFAPTQPYSGLPSMFGEELSEAKMWGMTPLDQLWCRIKFKQARYEGEFTPIMSDRSSIIYPSYIGGSNWQGVGYDPVRQLLAVNVNHFPMYNRLIARKDADRMGIAPYKPGVNELDVVYWAQMGTPWAMENKKFMGPLGTPCNEPPFGTLAVIDMRTGKFAWRQPIGKARDIGPFGFATHLPYTIGTPQLGGVLMTGTGLMFIGGTQEKTFRALDTKTGRVLWEDRLPAGAHANPMTYYSDRSGRQFVVVAASGHYQFANGQSDLLIAYALPRK
jgi:quinoprotein glucose dehydrogenase